MSAKPNHSQGVRHVMLPSGKLIEVVYFDDTAPLAPADGPAAEHTGTDLQICGTCSSKLVYPTDWEAVGSAHWRVTLRCPNCEWHGTGVFEHEVVERFDAELDNGTETLVRDLQRIARANMEDAVERFVRALHDDHILPTDF